MTTYQTLMKETGASMALVKSVKNDILGNRHHCTPQELKEIRTIIMQKMKEQDNDIIRESK